MYRRHPIIVSLFMTEAISLPFMFFFTFMTQTGTSDFLQSFFPGVFFLFLVGLFIFYPVTLTLLNGYYLFRRSREFSTDEKWIELTTIALAISYGMIYQSLFPIIRYVPWNEALVNTEKHFPLAIESMPTICFIAVLALIGYGLLRFGICAQKPPMWSVLSMAALYLGCSTCIVLCIQMSDAWSDSLPFLAILINVIILSAKVMKHAVLDYKICLDEDIISEKKGIRKLYKILYNSYTWPMLAFVFMWPLLGIIICILLLFGQRPDSVIRAFTETSDWKLSERAAPQNVMYDEHYLCTVAAGGHKKVVKPVRLGERHGHQVVVNRQLCIANAFEQILEERVPRFHKTIRHFYDTYGYPIARHIHSPYAADLVYIMMKPLEWIFVIVLYMVDMKPENRIAMQYLPEKSHM